MADPVLWAILRVVQAQNGLANAIYVAANMPPSPHGRRGHRGAHQGDYRFKTALEEEPRGFQ